MPDGKYIPRTEIAPKHCTAWHMTRIVVRHQLEARCPLAREGQAVTTQVSSSAFDLGRRLFGVGGYEYEYDYACDGNGSRDRGTRLLRLEGQISYQIVRVTSILTCCDDRRKSR